MRRFSSVDVCKVHFGGGWDGISLSDSTIGERNDEESKIDLHNYNNHCNHEVNRIDINKFTDNNNNNNHKDDNNNNDNNDNNNNNNKSNCNNDKIKCNLNDQTIANNLNSINCQKNHSLNNLQSSKNNSYNPYALPKKGFLNMLDISTQSYFILRITQPTWIYLTIIQKTKRGKNRSEKFRNYWYGSLSLVVLELPPQQLSNNMSRTPNTTFQYNKYTNKTEFENSVEKEMSSKDQIKMKNKVEEGGAFPKFGDVIGGTFSGSVRASSSVELQLLPGGYKCTYFC